MTPTPEQIAQAEKIASNSTYINGSYSWEVRKFGALAAIIETTNLAARLAYIKCAETRHVTLGDSIDEALRAGEHLKGPGA